MRKLLVLGLVVCAGLASPLAMAAKLDNSNAATSGGLSTGPASPPVAASNGTEFFALQLPLTDAVVARDFAVDHQQIIGAVDAAFSGDAAAKSTALHDTLVRIAISYELKIIDSPDANVTEIIDRQADYITAVIAGEGEAVCGPVIYDGSIELINRGLWEKYLPQIDATFAAYFTGVKQALDSPTNAGDMTPEDGAIVVDQMTKQGDKDLMDHFGVMTRDSPKNCPAVLALIKAAKVLDGVTGLRIRAAQARGASRL
jgi:hypothetical protein